MKSLLLLCFFFTLPPSLSAQRNFSPGFIILHNNDTLHGYIHFRYRKANPEKISFLNSSKQDTSLIAPRDIKGFLVHYNQTDHYYESHDLKKDYAPASAGQKPGSSPKEQESHSRFLYVYLKGNPYSLFYYQGKLSHFYLREKGGQLHELPNPDALSKKGRTLPMEKYKRQLFYFFADWPEAPQRIRRSQYNYQSLLKIFTDYNRFKGGTEEQIYRYKELPRELHAGILTGLSATRLNFSSQEKEFNHLTQGKEHILPSPALGLFLHIPLFNRLPSLTLYNELAYRSYKSRIEYTDHEDFWRSRTSTRFSMDYLKLCGMLRWQKRNTRYSPFVQAGPWYSYTIKHKNTSTKSHYNHSHNTYTPIYSGEAKEEFLPFELGISLGTGLSFQKLSTELRLDIGNGISNYAGLSTRPYTAALYLSYRVL